MKLHCEYLFFIVLIYSKYAVGSDLSSLTFVIDDTTSMWDEIDQVKLNINSLFNEILDHNDQSTIDNVNLITFNDWADDNPGIKVRAKTKDRTKFKNALDSIYVDGGAIDCAEFALTGIKKGLEESLPKSNIFVFTDATAKDYEIFVEVKKLAQTKQSRIVFGLTGDMCEYYGEGLSSPKYLVYQNLATATDGQVFHMNKNEIGMMLEYAKTKVAGATTTVVNQQLKPGEHNIIADLDVLMGEVTLTLSSIEGQGHTSVNIKAPDGSDVQTRILFETTKSRAYSIDVTKPGPHSVIIENRVDTHVVLTAVSGVEFEHGFSTFMPASISETNVKPKRDVESHVTIKLTKGNVQLKSVQIVNMDDRLIFEAPLENINNDLTLYTTPGFFPPATMFKMKIIAYDPRSKRNISRLTSTPVEAENSPTEAPVIDKTATNIFVGMNLSTTIKCKILQGEPSPAIRWSFGTTADTLSPRKEWDNLTEIFVSHADYRDSGLYRCQAQNIVGVDSHLVRLVIKSPPTIENKYKENRFVVMEGDLSLQITCNASGNPKPTIFWMYNGVNLTSGPNYRMQEDKLVINNIPKSANGNYSCIAKNFMGTVEETYEVVVVGSDALPANSVNRSHILMEEGLSVDIKCPLAQKEGEQLLWYKDGELIRSGELSIINATKKDSGHYACRVYTDIKSHSRYIYVNVGYKPKFTNEEKEFTNVYLEDTFPAILDCDTDGEPKGNVAWYFDDVKVDYMDENEFSTDLIGNYRCEVENMFGSISRSFNVIKGVCSLNSKEMDILQPLILTPELTWPSNRSENHIVIPRGESLLFYCPSKFNTAFKNNPTQYVTAVCNSGNEFLIYGKKYNYTDIKCSERVKHDVQKTGLKCMPGKTEIVSIGYNLSGTKYINAYKICVDMAGKPIYSKLSLQSPIAREYNTTWSDDEQFKINFDELYECKSQTKKISQRLRRRWHADDNCCFSRRQLVNPKDVFPGVPQESTYSYLNVVPHWSCFAKNWDDVEQRVRDLAKNSFRELLVWTGTAGQLTLKAKQSGKINDFLRDHSTSYFQKVPLFLWKVVQDPFTNSSLAIVQVNDPDWEPSDSSALDMYTYCKDICDQIDWMNSTNWRDVKRGYVYCCELKEFELAFHFSRKHSIFEPNMYSLLTMVYP